MVDENATADSAVSRSGAGNDDETVGEVVCEEGELAFAVLRAEVYGGAEGEGLG